MGSSGNGIGLRSHLGTLQAAAGWGQAYGDYKGRTATPMLGLRELL